MPGEFRTRAIGDEQKKKAGELTLEDLLNRAYRNIRETPELQLKLAQALQTEYGIDPAFLAAVVPELGETIQQAQEQAAYEQEQTMSESENDVIDVESKVVESTGPDLTPDMVVEIIDEFINYLGADTTLSETRTFVKDNPDLIETAIKMHMG